MDWHEISWRLFRVEDKVASMEPRIRDLEAKTAPPTPPPPGVVQSGAPQSSPSLPSTLAGRFEAKSMKEMAILVAIGVVVGSMLTTRDPAGAMLLLQALLGIKLGQ